MMRRVEQLAATQPPVPELAQQVVGAVRDELAASLKQRDEAVRRVQKTLLHDAQHLQLSAPSGAAKGSASSGAAQPDVQELERELDRVRRESQQAEQQAAAEKASLLAQIQAVQAQLGAQPAGAGNGVGATGAGARDVSVQTEEEARATTPGYGRRAVGGPAPTRQGTQILDHVGATASPLQQRGPADGRMPGGPLMVNTDNLGQVTPLSSFSPVTAAEQGRPPIGQSPLAGGQPRVSSAGRRSGQRRLAEGTPEENSSPSPGPHEAGAA